MAGLLPTIADPYDLDRLATAHEREAAWCAMHANALKARADHHLESAAGLRAQLAPEGAR